MLTKNYTLSGSGNIEQVLREEMKIGSEDSYNSFLEPTSFIIYVSGNQDVKVKLLNKNEDDSLSTGLYLTSGREYTIGSTDGNGIYKIIMTPVSGSSSIIVSCMRYIKTGEHVYNGIIS